MAIERRALVRYGGISLVALATAAAVAPVAGTAPGGLGQRQATWPAAAGADARGAVGQPAASGLHSRRFRPAQHIPDAVERGSLRPRDQARFDGGNVATRQAGRLRASDPEQLNRATIQRAAALGRYGCSTHLP